MLLWLFTYLLVPAVFGMVLSDAGVTARSWHFWAVLVLLLLYGIGSGFVARR